MAADTYTVKKGDTLWDLAREFGTTVAKLVSLNDISDPDYIVVGQKLKISGEATTTATNNTSRATIKVFGLQSNTDRTVYATWNWDKDNTDKYEVMWYYDTGDNVWFVGSDTTTSHKQSTYTAPTNANRVQFKVKPVSKTYTNNKKETSYWTASWSTVSTYNFSDNPPVTPSVPTVKIDKHTLTAELTNLDVNATGIQFQVVKNDSTVYKTGTATITTNSASFTCTVSVGDKYKVRCRSYKGNVYSDWSNYSDNVNTMPSSPISITVCRASSETSVYLEWDAVNTATSYEIEYAKKKEYFDKSDQTTKKTGIEFTKYEISGLESGEEYFFRVRAVNSYGESTWTKYKSIIIGKDPAAPTTWSSTTTAITGESLTLYWVHNAEDGSSQTYAELELIVDGSKEVYTIKNSTDEEEKDKTSYYAVNTAAYREGTKIQWRVRTAGITKVYGDWSIQRTVDIYAPPTLELRVTNLSGDILYTLTSFPFYIYGLAGPNTQLPIGYQLTVTSNEIYEAVDSVGNRKMVNKGEQIYSQYFDTSEELLVELSASNIDLENNVSYTVTCVVSMDSGLTAESSSNFTVSWADIEYEPNAEISIDRDTLAAYINPYCADVLGNRIPDITLSVYRREFDGSFTELATGIDNMTNTFITDPHPALDYARYRVVAVTNSTGAVSYYDLPGYPVGEPSVVIQWDEDWTSFEAMNEDEFEQPSWAGSMLKLPYNVDVSDKYSPDVSLVQYIGRKRPVSYYGTQHGESSTWKVSIDKKDEETLYALRRLAVWMGDVYVREPSGTGYWAQISVSFSQTHCEVTIPVTLEVTRVEGGA